MEYDAKIGVSEVILKSRNDWHIWFALLRSHSQDRCVWDYINPDGITVAPIEQTKPRAPEIPPVPTRPTLPDDPTPEQREDYEYNLIQYETKVKTRKLAQDTFKEEEVKYRINSAEWASIANKLGNIKKWIYETVDRKFIDIATLKLVHTGSSTPQAIVRILKADLAPTDQFSSNHVREQYRSHLEKAKHGRMTPEAWFDEWKLLYGKAQAFAITDVQGELALTDFLAALAPRIAPDFARTMTVNMAQDTARGLPPMTLDQLSQAFTVLLQQYSANTTKGKSFGIFAVTQPAGSKPKNRTKRTLHDCPCKPNHQHTWPPEKCLRLETALTGTLRSGAPHPLADTDIKKIRDRVASQKWIWIIPKVKEIGWNVIEGVAKSISTAVQNANTKPSYPNHPIVAAVINPTLIEALEAVTPSVNGISTEEKPLYMSTIHDGGGAIHVVNERSLLVPGTFRKTKNPERVLAGDGSLIVSGMGDRVFKNFLTSYDGPKTRDLLLKNVRVVDGFHVNIVAGQLLEDAGIWIHGPTSTLRYGPLNNSIEMSKVQKAHNLIFMEYKVNGFYSRDHLIVNAVRKSTQSQSRTGDEQLWHQRSGHLGQRALQALVKAAQNVQIEGTRRSECEHCARTHASQVISRRPREKPPRPFFRISWDLFHMPIGRLHEKWTLIIKEEYSGKLYNNNIKEKTIDQIFPVIRKFAAYVERRYSLKIVEIQQDNDTATIPWRGKSIYQEWAEEEGITINTPPPYTHEPNGSAERAGQELITKAIKMRISANLPEKLWPEVMDAAAYLHGMCPTKIHDYRSPNEYLDAWFREHYRDNRSAQIRKMNVDLRPNWSGIYAYGCRAYPLDRDRTAGRDKRGFKVNPRAHIGYLVGYVASNIYRIWVPTLDQVITTRNVTFDEHRFFEGDDQREMPREEATRIVEVLHDGEVIDPWLEIDISPPDEERGAVGPEAVNERELVDEPPSDRDIEAGQPDDQRTDGVESLRSASMASEHLGIRKDRNQTPMLPTPGATPNPESPRGARPDHDLREVHHPIRAGSSVPWAGESRDLRRASPIYPNDHAAPIDSIGPDEAEGSAPPTRQSRRIRNEAPEINRSMNVYPPIRRKRKDRDSGDQLGGGKSKGVFAVIAEPTGSDDPWNDFYNTFIPGIRYDWDEEQCYQTLNAVVMAATLKEETQQVSGDRMHRNDLPEPPNTWKQMVQHPMKALFEQAARKEVETLRHKGTWTEIRRPTSADRSDRPLPLKWVWTYKFDKDGYFQKCKARIVVRGDLQEKGTVESTYAATLAAKSFRTAMAIAADRDLEIKQFDVVGAFLNAKITAENPVICEMPDGFKKEGMCVKLNRALYGLRDSPLLWYEEFSGSLKTLGMMASKEEPCLFFDTDRKVWILFYVDDTLIMYAKENEAFATELWKKVTAKYEMQDQGQVSWFLGVRVIRDRDARTITLVHDTYIDKITKKYNLDSNADPQTPLPSEELVRNTGEATKQEIKAYQERVGSALYTAIMLRPDVAFAVSKLSHFLTNPSAQHMRAVERVIVYLYRTRYEAIQYGDYNGPDLVISGDASFADDPDTRRSSHGYIAMLYGGAIFWKAARQSTVTTSTTEAELLALEHVAKETMALKRFFKELLLDLSEYWTIWCDNQQTIRLVVGKNERITTRLRHVDIQNMWLRQEHAKGSFQVKYLETNSMPADGLTKSLTHQQFAKFKKLLNLQNARMLIDD